MINTMALLKKAHKALDEINTHLITALQSSNSIDWKRAMIIQTLTSKGRLERIRALRNL